MLKFLKIFFALVVVVIMALVAIPFFVNVNDYKPEIKQAVYDATGRNLDIGNIKLSLFPWVGFTLTDISLDNAENFSPAHILEVESIDIKVALIPLFDQQVEVKRFDLEKPKIWLSQGEDGSNNWSDLQQKSTAPKPTSTAPTQADKGNQQTTNQSSAMPAIAFEAKLLQLLNGQIFWQDSKGKLTLQNVDLKITDLQLQQPIGINLSADVVGAYKCNLTSGIMSGATCHTAGGTKPVNATCSCVDDGAGGFNPSPAACTCDAAGNVTTAGGKVEVTGRKAYGGTTNGGSIGILPMSNAGATVACDGTTLLGVTP